MLTTLTNYGTVPADKQAALIRGLGDKSADNDGTQLAEMIAELVRKHKAGL